MIKISTESNSIILTEDKDFGEWAFAHKAEGLRVTFKLFLSLVAAQILLFIQSGNGLTDIKMNNCLEDLISGLNLEPHPEGGFFRETYRSKGEIPKENLADGYSGNRNYSTCIYFLLTSDNFSAFHRINQDEIWHFYDGTPIRLHIISNDGAYSNQLIGIDIRNGQTPQFVVKGGSWFAAEVENENSYSLIGCTVSPGFSFDDFKLASRNELLDMFPENKEIIMRLTCE